MTFHLHTSNRLERLADELARQLSASPPGDPFAGTAVTVAHPGMARWLEIGLAERLGVVMRFDWPLPGRTVWELLQTLGDDLPESDPLDRPRLALRIWAGLREGSLPVPAELLGGEGEDDLRLWRIAESLADAFDQYPLYRPDWVRAWERGEPGFDGREALIHRFGWQAELWRALAGDEPHRLRLVDRLLERIAAGEPPAGLPERLLLFAPGHLPPLHLDLFVAIARVREVHLFVLTPSEEWWGDAPGRREARRLLLEGESPLHPLLAQWGREARDFIELLYERLDVVPHETHEHFVPCGDGTTLARVQEHLRTLQPPERLERDDSLVLHPSHGPMRACQEAVEAILAARREDPTLHPREIAILCSDIDLYAPFLEAAFESLPEGARLPYVLVDRRADGEAPLLAVAMELLRLPALRVTARWVRGLLDEAAIRRRFGIDEGSLPDLTDWLHRNGVRWGLDGEDRAVLRFAGEDRHSFAWGERRAMTGYALGEEPFALFEAIAPADGMEEERAEAVGGLLELVDRLRRWRRRLAGSRDLPAWCRLTAEMVGDLASPGADELGQLAPLHDALAALESDARALGLEAPMPASLFRTLLDRRMETPRVIEGYLAGSITCCAMQPLRNLPFRHIQVLGLDEQAFPRRDRRSALDALTVAFRRGDRSPRDDDRLMMLEILLSARDALHLHWPYRDPRDDSERQPSAPLQELAEYLQGGPGRAEASPFIRPHPMQPFSPRRYLEEPRAADPFWFAVASSLVAPEERREAVPLGDGPIPPPERREPRLGPEEIGRFLSGPAAWFLKQGVGVPTRGEAMELEEEEAFHLDRLEEYAVRDRLWSAFERGTGLPPRAIEARLRAEGLLPEGEAGARAWREQSGQWERIRKRLTRWWGERCEPLPLRLAFAHHGREALVEGWTDDLRRDGAGVVRLLRVRPGNLRARDRMALWVGLLAAVATGAPVEEARCVARDGDLVMRPPGPEQARRRLVDLARLALEGLTRPVPFVAEAVELWLAKDEGKREEAIEKAWNDTWHDSGEPEWEERPLLERIHGPLDSPFEIEGFREQVTTIAGWLEEVSADG